MKAFQSMWLLLLLVQQTIAATCNICGCENCQVGMGRNIVHYPNPREPGKKLQNNCQSGIKPQQPLYTTRM